MALGPHYHPAGMGIWARMGRILDWPMCGLVIPPGTRVDPDTFPEEEFPTWCLKCEYSLRGLTDNRCPECGTEFDRGQLLVREYVLEWGKWMFSQSPYGKRAQRRLVAAVVSSSLICFILSAIVYDLGLDPVWWLLTLLAPVSVCPALWIFCESRTEGFGVSWRKRRRVLEVIKADMAA